MATNGLKWQLFDKTGAYRSSFSFDEMGSFNNSIACVRHGLKYGFVDLEGKMVLDCDYESASDFSEGLAAVKHDGKYGFIDSSGKWAIKPVADYAHSFVEGLSLASVGRQKGYLHPNGDWLIEPSFYSACGFRESRAWIRREENSKATLLGIDGKVVCESPYWEGHEFSGGFSRVTKTIDPIPLDGYSDRNGDLQIGERAGYCGQFEDSRAIWCPQGDFSYSVLIDDQGDLVPKSKFDHLGSFFREGLITAREGRKEGMIDRDANWIVKPIYDEVDAPSEGTIAVRQGDMWGLISKTGETILPIKFYSINRCIDGLLTARIVPKKKRKSQLPFWFKYGESIMKRFQKESIPPDRCRLCGATRGFATK